ncbi:hypothetical protein Agub_g8588, partial [Astrephomene gubernaculifera]
MDGTEQQDGLGDQRPADGKLDGAPKRAKVGALQHLDAWKAAGIPRPKKRLFIGRCTIPQDISVCLERLSAHHLITLQELMIWALLRRDFCTAATVCNLLWKTMNTYRLRDTKTWLQPDRFPEGYHMQMMYRLMSRMMQVAAELLQRAGAGRSNTMFRSLQYLALQQPLKRLADRASREVALQLMEAGNMTAARAMLESKVSKQKWHLDLTTPAALLGLLSYREWMQTYIRSLADRARGRSGPPGSTRTGTRSSLLMQPDYGGGLKRGRSELLPGRGSGGGGG